VFVSYTSSDKPFVEELTDFLRTARVTVWVDFLEIRVGDSIVDKVANALRTSDILIIVLSKTSVASRWVREELNTAFFSMMAGSEIRVCPVLIEECNIPVFLRQRRYADFRGDQQSARQELLDGIMPRHSLWNELEQLHSEFCCIAKELAILTESEEVYKVLADLDILLNAALQKRYKIETRDDLNSIPYWRDFRDLSDYFYSAFDYLQSRGLNLISSAWASLRDFRNQFVHSYPGVGIKGGIILDNDSRTFNERVDHAKRRALEARSGTNELELVMETLCTPQRPR
jgi:hypothetical protein